MTPDSLEERLKKFAEYVLQLDDIDAQDKAEELGLIERRPVNPAENEFGADYLYFPIWRKK